MENNGFEVLEEEMVNRDTISIIVKKRPVKKEAASDGEDYPVKYLDVSNLHKSLDIISGEIDSLLARLEKEGKTFAIWGASHQGFTLAATTKAGERAAYMIDSAPFKQGRFAPASHVKIVPPDYWKEEPADAVLIVAPGYTDEIAGIIREKFIKEDGSRPEILTLKSNHLERL